MSTTRASFCVTSFDEADALRRLVRSSYRFASLVSEWVIIDHRSRDRTPLVIDALRGELALRKISLVTVREPRDLSASLTMADLRNQLLDMASSPLVVMADADFVFGPAFPSVLSAASTVIGPTQNHAVGFARPVIWDRIRTKKCGRIKDHGRVWVHKWRPGIVLRDAVRYSQTFGEGRWEDVVSADGRPLKVERLTKKRLPRPNTLVSINVKPADRLDLRSTMTRFMQDCTRGEASGNWLENYEAGTVRRQPAYEFVDMDLTGWKINAPNLRLGYDA